MTKTVLHIDSSARREGSVSRDLSAKIVDRLTADTVVRRDLATPLPMLSEDWINANFTPADQRSDEQKQLLAQSDALVEELKAADTLVIGAPIYNFAVASSLKAWIDLVARVGVTFKYTDQGPVGLLEGKRAIIALASGGTEIGSSIDFASGYLRYMLGFMGITDVEIVAADTLAVDADAALARANTQIESLAA
ncbi:FMN-dependent NADH-azoreductase [Phaeobacter gallaeciensis]|uniref:FMN-dependent NADH-azoreductase n=1 Tax=Phaeobacter gallaeciensis TaxID=60890 RepID=UPI00237F350A|nr:NAD(P)H-dependent oxidoreductase [Phaeobacter gallaeciensis]MDE4192360.1 NAD(P)H-dependent oxidoreductase [Phaeobacter gallaeciensis]MDE4200695.1 NAD(P)H-dependent oxidoreductase [Phaeobacter gallaeciensis]MDE4204976.1 NAD(P)H-dependent oxidoreductase [Phaeobacter gallaeciensis]MDE4209115.1 NAD(P)H-dependent oxidoreductase [Phaeobacter gallaeciensis]MDE4217483.1 NAD(P)H-dependent oxidoreductase [Phaeobacter gallaeciensis]